MPELAAAGQEDKSKAIAVERTDLFISIRYAHLTLLQLELELDEPKP